MQITYVKKQIKEQTVVEKDKNKYNEIQNRNPFEMLEELLWQDQFELIFPENVSDEEEAYASEKDGLETGNTYEFADKNERMQGTKAVVKNVQPQLRLVYLMNDAVESFLIFVNAKMTGQYQPDYEGELEAELRREEKAEGSVYVLVVRQGDSVVTIFFEDLKVETHLYRYGDLGHFWVKGYEYLRQLEYRIAILHTKCEYLGMNAASVEERKLAELVHFPPLNYACYPAVPEKYIVPMEDVWEPTEQAILIMEELAAEAGDHGLLRWLSVYRKHHGKCMSRLLAWMMHRVRHGAVVDLLTEKLMRASEGYPVRTYKTEKLKTEESGLKTEEVGKREVCDSKTSEQRNTSPVGERSEQLYEKILMQAELRKTELESQGKRVTLVREEPFTTAQDSVEYKVHLMVWQEKSGNRMVEVIEV